MGVSGAHDPRSHFHLQRSRFHNGGPHHGEPTGNYDDAIPGRHRLYPSGTATEAGVNGTGKTRVVSSAVKAGAIMLLLSNEDVQQGIEHVAGNSSVVRTGLTAASWVLDAPGSLVRSPLLNEKLGLVFTADDKRLMEANYGEGINTFSGASEAFFNLFKWNTRDGYTGGYETQSRRQMRLDGTLDDYLQNRAMEIIGGSVPIGGLSIIK